jgi:hypothetical protein
LSWTGARARLRRLGFGLSTVLGLKPRGFFIPYRHAETVVPAGYPALLPLFEAAEPAFRSVMDAIEAHRDGLLRIRDGDGPARFDQDWFPRLDAAAAYAMLRLHAPGLVVEVGSGHSTRFMARAARDGGLPTRIVCIDPAPRAAIRALPVEHVPAVLADADPGLFAQIGPGDVLFVDSSHIAMPGTDVDRLLLDVLPRLPRGALLHVHDVLLPDAYPETWAWRGYNEQLLVGALLQGGGFEPLFSSRYVATRRPDWIGAGVLAGIPLPAGALETSLWLRKA